MLEALTQHGEDFGECKQNNCQVSCSGFSVSAPINLNIYKRFFVFIKKDIKRRKGPQVWAKADRSRMHHTVDTMLTAASLWCLVKSSEKKRER